MVLSHNIEYIMHTVQEAARTAPSSTLAGPIAYNTAIRKTRCGYECRVERKIVYYRE